MRFLFVSPAQRSGDAVALDPEQTHYLFRVLRLQDGDELDLVPRGGGHRWRVRLAEPRKGRAVAHVLSSAPLPPPPPAPLRLFLSALKADKLEWALQKTVELGVDTFAILAARHSVKHAREVPPRFQAIVEAACQQSGRVHPPTLASVDLPGAIASLAGDQAFVLHPEAPRLSEADFDPARPVSYFIGPEGGLAADELRALEEAGARAVRLDGHILRAETAAIVAGALLLARLGRL